MKKKKLALKFKKALSLALAASMLCSLAACGSAGTKSNDQDDFRMTTEENTRIDEILIDQPEPQHVIADEVEITEDPAATTTEEPAPSANGQYSYDVDGVTITLHTNIDDYITQDSLGNWCVDLLGIAESLGLCNDGTYADGSPVEPDHKTRFWLSSDKNKYVYFDSRDGQDLYRVAMTTEGGGPLVNFARYDIGDDSINTYWITNGASSGGFLKVNYEQIVMFAFLVENLSTNPSEDWMSLSGIQTTYPSVYYINK